MALYSSHASFKDCTIQFIHLYRLLFNEIHKHINVYLCELISTCFKSKLESSSSGVLAWKSMEGKPTELIDRIRFVRGMKGHCSLQTKDCSTRSHMEHYLSVLRCIAEKLTVTPTNASLSTRDGSIARWKWLVDESPAFSSVTEVLTLVSWVERSIFRETSLITTLELKSSFPRVQDARSKAAIAAKRREKQFILRWKRILKDDYVESPQWVQRKRRTLEPNFTFIRTADTRKKLSMPSPSRLRFYELEKGSKSRVEVPPAIT